MKSRPTLFDETNPEHEAEADARAEADVREGRLVGHDAVKAWLASWGTDRPLPRPKIGD
jgi:predicted transcriptional regulator